MAARVRRKARKSATRKTSSRRLPPRVKSGPRKGQFMKRR